MFSFRLHFPKLDVASDVPAKIRGFRGFFQTSYVKGMGIFRIAANFYLILARIVIFLNKTKALIQINADFTHSFFWIRNAASNNNFS